MLVQYVGGGFWTYLSSDRNSGGRPSVHQKSEREQGAIMRHNMLGVFLKSQWNFSLVLIALKIHIRQDR